MTQGKSEVKELSIPAVTFARELKGDRGKKIMKVFASRKSTDPFITSRQVILSLIDSGLEKELNIK